MNQEKMEKYLNRNVKLHPLLNAFTWDVFFVWAISTMFFSSYKNLSYSQIISLDSILMLSGCLLCIPIQKLFKKVSPINSIRLTLCCYGAFILICMVGTHFISFVVAHIFLAFGYGLAAVKGNPLLTDNLQILKRDKEYNRIFGKGYSLYYIIECFGAIAITYVYTWNAYACFIVSFAVVVIALAFSLLYKNPRKFQESNIINNEINNSAKKQISTQKSDSYLKILKSSFVIFLLFYAFMLRGVLSISTSSYKVYLNQMIDVGAIPVWLFGYLFAISRLSTAIMNKYQFKFNLKFGVRSLIIFNVCLVVSFVVIGVLYLINPTNIIMMIVIIAFCCVLTSLRSPNQIFINNYIQICVPKKNIESAFAIKTTIEYMGFAIVSAIYASLLSAFNDNLGLAHLVYISIFVVPLIVSVVLFIRALCKKHAERFTIIKDEYTKD